MVWPDKTELNLSRVQTLGKFNHRLDSSWDDVLVKLDSRISIMVYEKMFDTLLIEGEFGGRKVFSDYTIKEYNRTGYDIGVTSIKKGVYLDWENDSIMKLINIVPIENNGDEIGF
jgi:hypothetical protein